MVTCKAHNLETEYACVGSIPTPATIFFFGEYRPLSSEQGKSCVLILVPCIRCSHGTIRVRQPVET